MRVGRILWACASVLLVALWGCGRETAPEAEAPASPPAVERGAVVELGPGETLRLASRLARGDGAAELPVSSDGVPRLTLYGARIPVLPAPAPFTIKQSLRLPAGGVLRTGFGLAPGSWDKIGGGARFLVRVHGTGGTVTLLDEEIARWTSEDAPNWVPVTLDLPASDEPVEIELTTEALGSTPAGGPERMAGWYALWLDPTISVGTESDRPNIVLVLVDALRADHLGCYGYERETSPFLDSLAARGVLFEDAQSQATATLPSMRSLLTSSYRFVIGHAAGKGSEDSGAESVQLVADSMPVSLQGQLRNGGYETLACVAGGFMRPEFGFDADFGWYWSAGDVEVLRQQLSLVKERLAEGGPKPFFLLLHTYAVHDYFQGWGHSLEQFDRGYLGWLSDRYVLSREAIHGDPKSFSAADLQYIQDLYDGEIAYTDRYLGIFVEWLLSQPWGRNTWIVVTSDHGEAFGEHGVMAHGHAPHVEVAHVPLLLIPPEGRERGRRVRDSVALVDLAPTLIEIAGLEAPEEMVGRSLVPALTGGKLDVRPALSESIYGHFLARQGDWWYLTQNGDESEELYNTAPDPSQSLNLAGSHPGELERMRGVLAELAMEAARGYRLVLSGERPEPVVVEIESSEPLSYFAAPTLRGKEAIEIRESAAGAGGKRRLSQPKSIRVRLEAGDRPHVILFEGQSVESSVMVSARVGDGEAPAGRFHLGERDVSPSSLPITLGPAARSLLTASRPPVAEQAGEWGIWLWITPAAARPSGAQTFEAEALSGEVLDQLKSLGYLR